MPRISIDTVAALSGFCEKASMVSLGETLFHICSFHGTIKSLILLQIHSTVWCHFQGCLVAPTLSVGSVLLQQAAISASFHYNNVEIVESRPNASVN